MIANLRRREICEMLKTDSAVTTASLAESFGVSVETVRKDLLFLEKEGRLSRVHGGALSKSVSLGYTELSERMETMKNEKREISEIAAQFIQNGDTIAVDTGSTAVEFVDVLTKRFEELTIVTHSAEVFEKSAYVKGFDVILCGGYFMRNENSFYGAFALDMLDKLHVGKAFVFPAALSLENGIFDCCPELAVIQKKLISISDEVIVAADSSKYEKNALIKVSDMSTAYTYVSDSKLGEEIREVYRNNDIKLVTEG